MSVSHTAKHHNDGKECVSHESIVNQRKSPRKRMYLYGAPRDGKGVPGKRRGNRTGFRRHQSHSWMYCLRRMSQERGACVFSDLVNEIAPKFEACDGLVVGSPVYYASANATLVALLDRLFYSTPFDKTMKVGAAVASARRGGLTATFDELNKYFTISGMPVAAGQYWNGIHGNRARRGTAGRRGLADDADAGTEYDLFDALH